MSDEARARIKAARQLEQRPGQAYAPSILLCADSTAETWDWEMCSAMVRARTEPLLVQPA